MSQTQTFTRAPGSVLRFCGHLCIWLILTGSIAMLFGMVLDRPFDTSLRIILIGALVNVVLFPLHFYTTIETSTDELVLHRVILPDRRIQRSEIQYVHAIQQHPFDRFVNGFKEIVEIEFRQHKTTERLRIAVNRYQDSEQLRWSFQAMAGN